MTKFLLPLVIKESFDSELSVKKLSSCFERFVMSEGVTEVGTKLEFLGVQKVSETIRIM